MTTYFVSRHTGAIEWARLKAIKVDRHLAHLEMNRIQPGDIVIGSLPVNLAAEVCAKNARYLHLSLALPYDARGVELDAEAMDRFGAKLEEYNVTRVST